MYVRFNPNPKNKQTGDCVVRAIAKAFDMTWDEAYEAVTEQGFWMKDMPSSNAVWGAYLHKRGMRRNVIPNTCPDCYTVANFASDNPYGTFVLSTGTHVVTVKDGCYFDAYDSGQETPSYYWR